MNYQLAIASRRSETNRVKQGIVSAGRLPQCFTGWYGTHFPTNGIVPVFVHASSNKQGIVRADRLPSVSYRLVWYRFLHVLRHTEVTKNFNSPTGLTPRLRI